MAREYGQAPTVVHWLDTSRGVLEHEVRESSAIQHMVGLGRYFGGTCLLGTMWRPWKGTHDVYVGHAHKRHISKSSATLNTEAPILCTAHVQASQLWAMGEVGALPPRASLHSSGRYRKGCGRGFRGGWDPCGVQGGHPLWYCVLEGCPWPFSACL